MAIQEKTYTACAECKRVCCWKGIFLCDESRYANVVELTAAELQALGREHSDYWDGTFEED